MKEADFERAVALLPGSPNRQALDRIVNIAALSADAPYAYLVVRRPTGLATLAAAGMRYMYAPDQSELAKLEPIFRRPFVADGLKRDPRFRHTSLCTPPLDLDFIASAPLNFQALPFPVTLNCADHRGGVERNDNLLAMLIELAALAVDQIRLLAFDTLVPADLLIPLNRTGAVGEERSQFESEAELNVVSNFLLSTLVPRRRLLCRSNVSYVALNSWRASAKDAQIAALKAVKKTPPPPLLEQVAQTLAAAVRSLAGTASFRYVTNVPCGHSGPGCFASKLAQATAGALGLEYVQAFEDLPVSGSSHPRQSARLPTFRLTGKFDGPVLLIDDVATSGRHLEKAALALRNVAPAVTPIVWIAG